jgi:hypothetical protein
MATRKELYEQMIEDRAHEAVEARGANRRARVLTMLACMAWCALGGAILAWGVMTHDVRDGKTAFAVGPEVAAAGTILTLIYSYLRAEKRGDR